MGYAYQVVVGNLTKDSETKYLNSGTAICEFCVAVNIRTKNNDEVFFQECKLFGKRAESLGKYLIKGKEVVVSGNTREYQWNDKKTGEKKRRRYINVNDIHLTNSRNGDSQGNNNQDNNYQSSNNINDNVQNNVQDDVPF